MTQTIDLKALERKAFTASFQDGLLEIMIGVMLLQMVVGRLLDHLQLPGIWVLAVSLTALLLWGAGKKYVTAPRVGVVRFGPARERRLKTFAIIACISLLTTVGLVTHGLMSGWRVGAIVLMIAVPFKIVVIFSLAAYFKDYPRLYAWGVLIALTVVLGELLATHTRMPFARPAPYAAASAILLVTGASLLIRFLREYPLPGSPSVCEEGSDVGK